MSTTATVLENNFYVTGGTLSRDARCYVVREADQALYDGLQQGPFCYVLTSRQMGKSSLMVRTAARLREEGAGVVVLDLTAIGQNLSAEQWYSGLLTQMAQQLELDDELEEFWDAQPKLGPLQRWMQALQQIVLPRYADRRVVVFVDEIDAVRSLPFSTDEFFAAIRECYNRRTADEAFQRLTFCLLGVASPSDLIRDTRTTPFNIGQRIELHDFTAAEAAPLAQGLPEQQAKLLERVLYWTNGHPHLTQRLCQAISETNSHAVDQLCHELFLSHEAQERDDNLLFVRERLLRSEVDLADLLSFYVQVHKGKRVRNDVTNPLVTTLRLSGVTRVQEGLLRIRNRIYEQVFNRAWVKENLPDAEVRRQREAYRRGLLRAASVAALIIAAIASLAFAALKQRNRAEVEARRADVNLQKYKLSAEEAQRNLVEAERQRQHAEEQGAEAAQQREQAIRQQQLAEQQRARTEVQRELAVKQKLLADQQRVRADQQTLAYRRLLYASHMNLAQQAWETASLGRMQELLDLYFPKSGQEDLRSFEWYYLWRLCHRALYTFQHTSEVSCVTFSPDGRKIGAASTDGAVKLWDAASGQELSELKGQTGMIFSTVFSPDGQRIASVGIGDRALKLRDTATGQELTTFKMLSPIWAVTFSPDGSRIAAGSQDGTVKVWELATERELLIPKGSAVSVAPPLAFSPDGGRLAGRNVNLLKLWQVATGQEILTLGDTGLIYSVAFSPDGKRLATGNLFGDVRLWDAASGKEQLVLKAHMQPVFSVAFSPDGQRLASGSGDRTIKLSDVATGKEVLTIKAPGERVLSVAFSPDGQRLVSGSGGDGTVSLWELVAEPKLLSLKGRTPIVLAVAFSPDRRVVASVSHDRTIRLWDANTGQELSVLKGHTAAVFSVAFSPDGKKLAAGSFDSTVKFWDVTTGQELFTLKGHARPIHSVTFSPDGKLLASGSQDNTVKLWDVATGQERLTLKGHTRSIRSVAFSPDGKLIATGSSDRTVKLWDAATGEERFTINGHAVGVTSVAFSPDGKLLVTGSADRTVKLWDVATGQEQLVLKGHTRAVNVVAFAPDGKRIASGSEDQSVRLWDISTGQEVLALKHFTSNIIAVAFSPDGKQLATGSNDGVVQLWRAATDKEVLARTRR